jgi:hypothetical protein
MPAIAEGKTNERPAKKFSGSRRKIKVLALDNKGSRVMDDGVVAEKD